MGTIYLEGICYSSGGGGGGSGHTILDDGGNSLPTRTKLQFKGAHSDDNSTSQTTEVNVVRSMTKAEFDQLSADEKVGIINITDITSGRDDRFQPVIYSTDEREIGVWTDGKPLYEKTFVLASEITLTANSWTQITGVSVANIDTPVKAIVRNTRQVVDSVNVDFIDNPITITTNLSNVKVDNITLQYTKITDVAGSGTWTPQGIPAAHYSTDEHVVGTWIDGSTLYEKTFYSDMTIPYDSASAITLNDTIPSNIEVVDIQAYFRGKNVGGNQIYQSDGGKWFNYYYESADNKIYASQIFTSGGVTNCKTYFTFRYIKSSS